MAHLFMTEKDLLKKLKNNRVTMHVSYNPFISRVRVEFHTTKDGNLISKHYKICTSDVPIKELYILALDHFLNDFIKENVV